MSKIQDNLPSFHFGLWNECPEHAPVAWGARGIADQGVGFSLLPDRQTMLGLEQLREPFSAMVLNKGPLAAANKQAKRLRHGWDPIKELITDKKPADASEFFSYFKERMSHIEDHIHGDVAAWLFDKVKHRDDALSKEKIYELLCNPGELRIRVGRDRDRIEAYYKTLDRQDAEWERNPPTPPPPPKHCENDEYYDEDCDAEDVEPDDCPQDFVKVAGKYEGCTWYVDSDAWICDLCGYEHYVEWSDHPDRVKEPATPVLDAFGPFFDGRERMYNDCSDLFTLFDDHHLKILGNTNGSHGYVYLIAYPHHQIVDLGEIKWSGSKPPPNPGEVIQTRNVGECLVFGHLVFHGWLHINVLPINPPEWYLENVKRGRGSRLTNVSGNEIE